MRLFDYLTFLVALIFYLPRLALFWVYRVLLFISKPGSLYILPALLGGLMYWQYDLIRGSFLFDWWLYDAVMPFAPHERIDQDYWYFGVFWVVFTLALYFLIGGRFQILGTVLTSLPQMRRPFPPQLRLRLIEQKIKPAAVMQVVPKLKRRRKADITLSLSEPLKRLLAPAEAPQEVEDVPTPPPSPEAPPAEPESVPEPQDAKEEAEARPKRKPPPPPLPPKAQV